MAKICKCYSERPLEQSKRWLPYAANSRAIMTPQSASAAFTSRQSIARQVRQSAAKTPSHPSDATTPRVVHTTRAVKLFHRSARERHVHFMDIRCRPDLSLDCHTVCSLWCMLPCLLLVLLVEAQGGNGTWRPGHVCITWRGACFSGVDADCKILRRATRYKV